MEFIISLLPFALIILVMWFFMVRPQKKQAEKTREMLNSLGKGDSVVTIGGLHGVIDEVDESTGIVVLDCEGIYLTFERRTIGRVVSKANSGSSETEPEDLGTNQPESTDEEE